MSNAVTRRACLGDWIKVKGLTPEQESFEDVFHLVSHHESGHAEPNVSISSLLGEALSGTKVGDEIVLDTKAGPMKLTVLQLGPDRRAIQ